jgi:uncharacterized protein (DUF2336 family)
MSPAALAPRQIKSADLASETSGQVSHSAALAPRYAKLANLSGQNTSEGRRELLRQVVEALDPPAGSPKRDIAEFDEALAEAAADYSMRARAEIARLVAAGAPELTRLAQTFAFDEFAVAEPILRRSTALSEETLLKVVEGSSQDHLMAVTKRHDVSQAISHALVKHGDDHVVTSLLQNERADIAPLTYDIVATRAESSSQLHAPLIHRKGVPPELLNDLYLKVETHLKREIVSKLEAISPDELEKAFQRSRTRTSNSFVARPEDFEAALKRVDGLARTGGLTAPVLVALLREGKNARTAFKIAFAQLTDTNIDLIERVVEGQDVDTVALLCRGANIDRAVFVALAVSLDADPGRAMAGADKFMKLYDSVPVQAAQRALRFWKVRLAA